MARMNEFFDLSDYAHTALFAKGEHVWDALEELVPYLNGQKLGNIEGDVAAGAYLVRRELISLGRGSRVEPGAYIEGPCLIGPECVVRHGAYIRGGVVTGARCIIGHDTEIKHSILLNEVAAAHFNYVGDSILGNQVNLGAGAKCANVRLDRRNVKLLYMGKRVQTPFSKLGAIVGDGAQIGCNAVLNPGTLMGKGAICFPCVNVGGTVAAGGVVRR